MYKFKSKYFGLRGEFKKILSIITIIICNININFSLFLNIGVAVLFFNIYNIFYIF